MQEEENDVAVVVEPYDKWTKLVFSRGELILKLNSLGVRVLVEAFNLGETVNLTYQEAELDGPPEIFMINTRDINVLEIQQDKPPKEAEIIPIKPHLIVPAGTKT